ncbi:hypothetical protein DIPPA_09670 [Diplonema papillatum]|nr:hypothetical protein DIPPA_09670 [Diplonema papillatum]
MLPVFTEDLTLMQEVFRAKQRMNSILDADKMSEEQLKEEEATRAKSRPNAVETPSTPSSSSKSSSAPARDRSVTRATRASTAKRIDFAGVSEGATVSRKVTKERRDTALSSLKSWSEKGAIELNRRTRRDIWRRDRVNAYTMTSIRQPSRPLEFRHKYDVLKKMVRPAFGEDSGVVNMLEVPDMAMTKQPEWCIVGTQSIAELEHDTDLEAIFHPDPSEEEMHYLNAEKPKTPKQISQERYTLLAKHTASSKGKSSNPDSLGLTLTTTMQ